MPDFPASLRLSGEITERAELLNGAMQLSLDGVVAVSEDPSTIELALSWRLGRAGAVALDEGDLTLESAASEVVAVLDAGTAELDPDTGNVEVEGTFVVESATGVTLAAGALLTARLEIGAESWSGELNSLSDGADGAGGAAR
jgi:hypothetical protein